MHLTVKEDFKARLKRHLRKTNTAPGNHDKIYPIHYLKRLIKEREMNEEKEKSINYRNEIIEKQKIANYTNEISRIRGEMSRTIFKGKTLENMEARKRKLIQLGGEVAD